MFNDVANKFTRKRAVFLMTLGVLLIFLLTIISKASEEDKKETRYDPVYDIQGFVVEGDLDKQLILANMYYFGDGISRGQDYDKAFELYEKAAQQGNAEAQYNLGVMYYSGESVHQDYTKARQWLEKAAAQNYIDAQFSLGVIYQDGEGVPPDITIAKKWFSKSCDNGNEDGCDSYQLLD